MNKKIIIVCGDPNSINSEIIFKSWKQLNNEIKKNIYLIGNYELLTKQFKILKFSTKITKVENVNGLVSDKSLKIIDIPLNFRNPFKVPLINAAKYVTQSLDLAHNLVLKYKIKGIINCPINKSLIKKSRKRGVTEFFASKCKVFNNSEVMMIHNKKFSVVPLTTHINLKKVSNSIKREIIIKKVITLDNFFKRLFKRRPKIGVLGLNPHNAEFAQKSEENLEIIPAIMTLKRRKFKINGPLVADTIFINNYKKYDVIIGMYHDQVLAPFKSLFKYDAINITLGLKYIRVSPDHGPAIELIKKNQANQLSLFQSIKFINNLG